MSRVRRFEHFDFTLASPTQTPEGFWRVEGRVARTGVQHYTDSSGTRHGEYRSDEEVRKSLPGFARAPLCNQHPPQMVTPDNAKQYVDGAVGEAKLDTDGWVTAPLTVYTQDAITAMKAGRVQLSVGYSCEVCDETGEHDGISYTHVQRNIAVNHVAIVDSARAGPEARIRLDAGDAESDSALGKNHNGDVGLNQRITKMTHVLKLDGMQFEVSDPNAQAIVEKAIATARKDGDDKATAEKDRADAADKARSDLQKSLSELQAKHDALVEAVDAMKSCSACDGTGKYDGAKCDDCGGEGEYETKEDAAAARDKRFAKQVQDAARTRAALISEATRHLGKNENLDELTDLDIKKLVVAKLVPKAKLDVADAVYIQARYDAAVEAAGPAPTAVDAVRAVQAVTAARSDAAKTDPEAARLAMLERNRNMLAKKGA